MFIHRYLPWLIAALVVAYYLRSGQIFRQINFASWPLNATARVDSTKEIQAPSQNHDITAAFSTATLGSPVAIESSFVVEPTAADSKASVTPSVKMIHSERPTPTPSPSESSPGLVTKAPGSTIHSKGPTPTPRPSESSPGSVNEAEVTKGKPHTENGFDGLLELCSETQWTHGLWLHCHNHCGENQTSICGGLNNARSRIQTCLRYAIDAGMGIILPSVAIRDESALLQTDGGLTVPTDKFWDVAHLQKALGEKCPQFRIRTCDDTSGIDRVLNAPSRYYMDKPYTNGTFRAFMGDVLEVEGLKFTDATSSDPIMINFADPYVGWDYRHSSELSTIRKALFKVLIFNEQLLKLSSKILQSPELQEGAFIGVHLRGEGDWPAHFGGAHDQMRLYVEAIEGIQTISPTEVKTVYVSCGDSAAIGLFRDLLSPLGYRVHDKWSLLAGQPDILAKVEGLGFDEKAIVEYQTLVQAKFWMGIITSSMSSLIAYARSVDDKQDFFDTYVFPGSDRAGFNRGYPDSPAMRGNNVTKLMVVSGADIMDSFP